MSAIVVAGDTSGSVTLNAPAVSGTTVITLPTTSGTMITTASSGQSIPKAALPAGTVLQVVNSSTTTLVTVTSTSFVTTGVTGSITPISATSKILITVSMALGASAAATIYPTIFRGTVAGTNLGTSVRGFGGVTGGSNRWNMTFLDSPSTASSQTYTVGLQVATAGQTGYCNEDGLIGSITLMEIAA